MDDRRTITRAGTAKKVAESDLVCVCMSVSGVSDTYGEGLEMISASTNAFSKAVTGAGLERELLKTYDILISQHMRHITKYKKDREEYVYIPEGYDYSASYSVEFPHDNEILSKVVTNISNTGLTPKVDFSFRSSQYEVVRGEALSNASQNAKSDAERILAGIGARLGKVVCIDREDESCLLIGRGPHASYDCSGSNDTEYKFDFDIVPANITVSESVTITSRVRHLREMIDPASADVGRFRIGFSRSHLQIF